MNRIEFSRQTAEAVPLHAPVSGLPTSAPDVPVLLPRHETSGLRRIVQWRFLRPLVDALGLVGALVLALRWPHEPVSISAGWPLLIFPPLVMLLLLIRGMYERRLRPTILDGVVPIAGSVSIAAMFVVVLQVYAGGAVTISSVVGPPLGHRDARASAERASGCSASSAWPAPAALTAPRR